MSYIWEDYSIQKTYYSGNHICPYVEVLSDYSNNISVNPLIRFPDIFQTILETAEYIDDIKKIENIVYHFLIQLDKCKGLDIKQVNIEILRDEIEKGYYGEKCCELWKDILPSDKNKLLFILEKRVYQGNKNYFMDAINLLFQNSSLCYEEKTDLFYLYLGSGKTVYNYKKLEIIKLLFWNIKYNIIDVWDKHYGIVGVEDTMKVSNIQII